MPNLRRVLEYVALTLILVLSIDASISLVSCQIVSDQASNNQDAIKYCGIFNGPFLKAFIWSANFFDSHGEAVIAAFTAILAISTIMLWRSTERLWISAKQASDLARQEFVATHRPKLRIRHLQLMPPHANAFVEATMTVTNIGTTDAKIIAVAGDIAFRNENYEWEPPGLNAPFNTAVWPQPVKSGQQRIFNLRSEEVLSLGRFNDFHYFRVRLCIVGMIRYSDDNGYVRHTGFFRIYDRKRKRFEKADEPDYEYED